MTKKSRKSAERGPTWVGYYPRRTKTKKEKIKSLEKKHKKSLDF